MVLIITVWKKNFYCRRGEIARWFYETNKWDIKDSIDNETEEDDGYRVCECNRYIFFIFLSVITTFLAKCCGIFDGTQTTDGCFCSNCSI